MNRHAKRIFMVVCIFFLVCLSGISYGENWSTTAPDCIYKEKTQYKFRTKETTQSSSSTLSGWTKYAEEPGDWGSWISNGTKAVTGSTDKEVRTVYHEAVTQVSGYRYKHYRYYNSSNGSVYYTYGTGYADRMGYSGYWETKETTVAERLGTYKVYDGVQSYGAAGNFWFYEEEIITVVSEAYTEYQYRTRPRTYFFYKWGSWSNWQDESVTASDTIDVKTRTLYAADTSKLTTGIRIGSVSELPMLASTGCQIQYKGNGKDAEWKSSNVSVASVSQSGYISAYKVGTAVITAELANGETYTIKIIVKNWKSINTPHSLSKIDEEAFAGGSYEYVDLTGGAVSIIGNKAFSNNKKLRLVKANNQNRFGSNVFAGSTNVFFACEGEGAVTDYAKAEGIPYYVVGPTVSYQAATSIKLNKNKISIKNETTYQLSCEVLPQNATNQSVAWSSSDPQVASVSSNGLVTALSDGKATITVASRNDHSVKAECSVTVLPITVESISLDKQSVSLITGQKETLTATVLPTNAKNKTIQWTSSNEAVANVDGNGVINAKGAGTTTITAASTDGSAKSATCVVTVKATDIVDDSMFTSVYVDSITETNAVIHAKASLPHNPSTAGYYFGTSSSNLILSATEDSSGMPLNNQIIWYDLNKWGKTLTPRTTYYYQFYIVYDGVTYRTSIRSFSTSGNIVVNGEEGLISVNEGENHKISITYSPSNASIQWSSANTSIATVDQQGNVYGVKGGTTTITATVSAYGQSINKTFNISVNPITYRILIDVNYMYQKEQLFDAYGLKEIEAQEYCLNHPILGFFEYPYEWASMKEWHPSPAKVNDGSALANIYRQFLVARGQERSDLHYCYDTGKSTLLSNITSVFSESDENDVNIFFFGGHGNKSNSLFLTTGETIAPVELLSAFNGIRGNNVLLLSCCYSGAVANTMRSYPYASGAVLAACESNHLSWSAYFDGVECSYDVYYFLKGIGFNEPNETVLSQMAADNNKDGKVTVAEICSYMNAHVYKSGEGEEEQKFTYYYPNGNIVVYSR